VNTPPLYEELLAAWTAATTERGRAEVEQRMAEASAASGTKYPRERILQYVPAQQVYYVERRRALLLAGSLADRVWAMVDGPEALSLNSAAKFIVNARKHAVANGTTPEQALDALLEEHGKLRHLKSIKGKSFSRRLSGKEKHTIARRRWAMVRKAIRVVTDHELLKVTDRNTRAVLRNQLETEIDTLMNLLTARVAKVSEDSRAAHNGVASTITAERRSLKAACDTLSIDRPRSGVIDHETLVKAKKNFRALAKEHHPDHGGSAERYQAVVEAMTVVEASFRRETDTSATEQTNTNE
jgi:hypothetical protein